MGEVSIGGVFLPAALIWAAVALVLSTALRRLLAAVGAYRLVWHRALFDLALTVILFGAVVGVASRVVGP